MRSCTMRHNSVTRLQARTAAHGESIADPAVDGFIVSREQRERPDQRVAVQPILIVAGAPLSSAPGWP